MNKLVLRLLLTKIGQNAEAVHDKLNVLLLSS